MDSVPTFKAGDKVQLKMEAGLDPRPTYTIENPHDKTDMVRVGGDPVNFYVRFEGGAGYHQENLILV